MKARVLFATLLIASCDNGLPRLPADVSSPGHSRAFQVSGVVRVAGQPLAGAKVAVLAQLPETHVLTDRDGRYTLMAQTLQPNGLSPLVSARKDGYFTAIQFVDSHYAPIAADTTLDLTLDPLVHVSIGEVVNGSSGSSGLCAHWQHGSGPCDRFAITAPSTGRLDIITAGVTSDVEIVGPDGTFEAYDSCECDPRIIQTAVRAGLTYEIRVTRGRTPFELTTALR